MKLFRDLKWWLADRFEPLNTKTAYYNPQAAARRAEPLSWNGILLMMVRMILVGAGAFGVLVGGIVLWALFTS